MMNNIEKLKGGRMKKTVKYSYQVAAICIILMIFLLIAAPVSAKHRHKKFEHNPIIFVHGGAGSAAQFESQAMRFMSNGYPKSHLHVLEYDSGQRLANIAEIHANLDALISQVLESTGKGQVDLMGHSMGTYVSQYYLKSSPLRAARVAHYINIDGLPEVEGPPGGVDTLALWAGIGRGGIIMGGQNVTLENQTHVEAATSAESFYEMYNFFTGKTPKTTMIVLKRRGMIEIAGRACLFPENVGVDGAILKIYKVWSRTGKRIHKRPRAVYEIGPDGNWGPFRAVAGERFEFVIVREGQDHHYYKEPFVRSDYFVRLQTSPVGEGIGANVDTDPAQVNLIMSRDKEFWGERPLESDILAINGVNVINEATGEFANRTNVIYAFDENADMLSYIDEPIDYFHQQPFMTGVDLFIPTEGVRIALTPRGGNGMMQVINIPGWPSDYHRISILFNDFVQWDNIP